MIQYATYISVIWKLRIDNKAGDILCPVKFEIKNVIIIDRFIIFIKCEGTDEILVWFFFCGKIHEFSFRVYC